MSSLATTWTMTVTGSQIATQKYGSFDLEKCGSEAVTAMQLILILAQNCKF